MTWLAVPTNLSMASEVS